MKSKIIYGILALLISLGLWVYVVTVVNPEWEETFYNIPVILENEEILHERGLMLAADEDPKVTLTLSGKRTDMLKLNASNITLRADLSRIYSAGEQRLSYTIVYPDSLPSNAFEIISQSPQQITLSVVERMTKPVDVLLKIGEADDGYIALEDEAVLDYEKITISGPANVVDSIVTAEVTIDLAGQKETISQEFEYVLRDAAGNVVENKWIKANTEKVHCTLKIQRVMDVTISVDILEGAGLTAADCEIYYYNKETEEPLEGNIAISGSVTQLSVLERVGLLAATENGYKLILDKRVSLSQMHGELAEDGSLEIVFERNLHDLLAPYEITNQSPINVVKVVVKIPGQSLKDLTITEFTWTNVPGGAAPKASFVKVFLRGPQEKLDLITEENVQVTVDLAGAAVGDTNKEFPVEIIVTGESGVFVVGTYKVSVTIQPMAG